MSEAERGSKDFTFICVHIFTYIYAVCIYREINSVYIYSVYLYIYTYT